MIYTRCIYHRCRARTADARCHFQKNESLETKEDSGNVQRTLILPHKNKALQPSWPVGHKQQVNGNLHILMFAIACTNLLNDYIIMYNIFMPRWAEPRRHTVVCSFVCVCVRAVNRLQLTG